MKMILCENSDCPLIHPECVQMDYHGGQAPCTVHPLATVNGESSLNSISTLNHNLNSNRIKLSNNSAVESPTQLDAICFEDQNGSFVYETNNPIQLNTPSLILARPQLTLNVSQINQINSIQNSHSQIHNAGLNIDNISQSNQLNPINTFNQINPMSSMNSTNSTISPNSLNSANTVNSSNSINSSNPVNIANQLSELAVSCGHPLTNCQTINTYNTFINHNVPVANNFTCNISSNTSNESNASNESTSLNAINYLNNCGPILNNNSKNSMCPIDMEDQERIKLERKRMRNRIAASKCRRRKIERISRLEEKNAFLKNEIDKLQKQLKKLSNQNDTLQDQLTFHLNSGCEFVF